MGCQWFGGGNWFPPNWASEENEKVCPYLELISSLQFTVFFFSHQTNLISWNRLQEWTFLHVKNDRFQLEKNLRSVRSKKKRRTAVIVGMANGDARRGSLVGERFNPLSRGSNFTASSVVWECRCVSSGADVIALELILLPLHWVRRVTTGIEQMEVSILTSRGFRDSPSCRDSANTFFN